MKKITALLLLLSCLLLFSSCDLPFIGPNPFGSMIGSSHSSEKIDAPDETHSPETKEDSDVNVPDPEIPLETEAKTEEDSDTNTPDPEISLETESKTEADSDVDTPDPEIPLETESKTEADSDVDEPANPFVHQSVPFESYYQYSQLTANKKIAYNRMRSAVLAYENEIDISDLSIEADAIVALVGHFIADNPQYFWLAPTYGYNTEKIVLNYTDGTHADTSGFGDADRAKIDERRAAFERAVDEIISAIDPALSDYEKELYIHDYLTRTVHYDTPATTQPTVNGVHVDAFCAYGALIGKSSVCEGYTEAFQYLCYRVGINANQVFGIGHVWNVVEIDGEWYQTDVTWDDPINQYGTDGDGNHKYFNLTDAQMYAAHARDTASTLFTPTCTSTEHAYREEVTE